MKQQRILIAEDDEVQGALFAAAMRHRGYVADIVGDGLEAVRNLQTGAYDLALLDYNMPHVDGRAVAQLVQDLPPGFGRPRLIALTAAAGLLNACETANGSASFDAVVSKDAGLLALFEVIEQNLKLAAELNAASALARWQEQASQRQAQQTRRRRAPLFALPGLAAAAGFAIALVWAGHSIDGVASSIGSAQFTASLNTDAQLLVGAVADTQVSQRSYVATGLAADRMLYDADQMRVDRLLSAAARLDPSGTPGFSEEGSPIPVILTLLHTLGEEAEMRSALRGHDAPLLTTAQSSRDAADKIRDWAISLVTDAQRVVVNSLSLVQQNMKNIMIILVFGLFYSVWHAAASTWRQFKAAGPRVRLPDVGVFLPLTPMTREVGPRPHRLN